MRLKHLLRLQPTFPICRLLKAYLAPLQRGRQGWRAGTSLVVAQNRAFRAGARGFGSVRRFSVTDRTHLTSWLGIVHRFRCSCREWRRPWSEPLDPAQDLGEQGARHRHLGELEDGVATVAHDPRADLTSFSRRVVSDQCSTSSGSAKVRMKLARL